MRARTIQMANVLIRCRSYGANRVFLTARAIKMPLLRSYLRDDEDEKSDPRPALVENYKCFCTEGRLHR